MEEKYSWKELEKKFEELSESLKGLRLDYQWGSVPSLYSLASWSDNIQVNKFKEISFITGRKLLENYKNVSNFKEVFTSPEPLTIWYNTLRLFSGHFNIGLAADQTKDGVSIGVIYHGSINNVVAVSAIMCMRLSSFKLPKPQSQETNSKIDMKNKKEISKRIEKKIFQEANSTCPFCGEREISLLDIHHIMPRQQGGPNEEINLILVCKKCHTDIEDGIITVAEVMKKKQELIQQKNTIQKSSNTAPVFNLNKNKIESSIIAGTVNFKRSRIPKMQYPLGSIGANIDMNNYIKYLIDMYFHYCPIISQINSIG